MTPTEQQQHCIIKATLEKILKMEACAGAGKTSTLNLIATALPEQSLYMAFNKVTALEATGKFPKYVECRTTHSLAHEVYGRALQHKLKRPTGKYVNVAGTGSEIAKYYKLRSVESEVATVTTANAIGLYVRKTVERFEQSADFELEIKHMPKFDMEKAIAADPSIVSYVFTMAKRLWKDRIDSGSVVLATHDTYLKLFQLSKPNLPYNIIYLDEAQDTTPCVLDIFMRQAGHAKLILVGDRRQAIYAWRGATNAMASVHCESAPLSKSFRYGNGIAEVATKVLHNDMIISGRDDLDSIIGLGVVDRTKPHMCLFRTNSLLLTEAVSALDRGEKIKIEIDVRDFVKLLESAQALHADDMRNVKHEMMLPYPSWYSFLAEVKEINGGELPRVAKIVDSGSASHIIAVLHSYIAPEDAIATYTTAHKAKGREADQVVLADDFGSNYKKGEWIGMPEHDENLLYVAVTRAQRVLQINTTVAEILDKHGVQYIISMQDGEAEYNAVARQYDVLSELGITEDSPPWN